MPDERDNTVNGMWALNHWSLEAKDLNRGSSKTHKYKHRHRSILRYFVCFRVRVQTKRKFIYRWNTNDYHLFINRWGWFILCWLPLRRESNGKSKNNERHQRGRAEEEEEVTSSGHAPVPTRFLWKPTWPMIEVHHFITVKQSRLIHTQSLNRKH